MVIEPTSMDQCIYFTNRILGNGKVKAWVYKQKCPRCGKSLMSKPKDSKGKIKIRATEYTCETCHYTVSKDAKYNYNIPIDSAASFIMGYIEALQKQIEDLKTKWA